MTRPWPDGEMGPQERAGVFVVRVWIEADANRQFKARITYSLDLSRPEQTTEVVSEPGEVKAALAAWLDEFMAMADGNGAETRR